MDPSTVSGRDRNKDIASPPPTRNPSRQARARQAEVDNAVQQERRVANNREAMRRQASAAFRESVERDRAVERQNMQAGVEKMVRSVVRKESAQTEQSRAQDNSHQNELHEQDQYVREKLKSTYSSTASESPRDESQQPSPSQRQQQRAIDDYQQSTRNSIDRAVELVI